MKHTLYKQCFLSVSYTEGYPDRYIHIIIVLLFKVLYFQILIAYPNVDMLALIFLRFQIFRKLPIVEGKLIILVHIKHIELGICVDRHIFLRIKDLQLNLLGFGAGSVFTLLKNHLAALINNKKTATKLIQKLEGITSFTSGIVDLSHIFSVLIFGCHLVIKCIAYKILNGKVDAHTDNRHHQDEKNDRPYYPFPLNLFIYLFFRFHNSPLLFYWKGSPHHSHDVGSRNTFYAVSLTFEKKFFRSMIGIGREYLKPCR